MAQFLLIAVSATLGALVGLSVNRRSHVTHHHYPDTASRDGAMVLARLHNLGRRILLVETAIQRLQREIAETKAAVAAKIAELVEKIRQATEGGVQSTQDEAAINAAADELDALQTTLAAEAQQPTDTTGGDTDGDVQDPSAEGADPSAEGGEPSGDEADPVS